MAETEARCLETDCSGVAVDGSRCIVRLPRFDGTGLIASNQATFASVCFSVVASNSLGVTYPSVLCSRVPLNQPM